MLCPTCRRRVARDAATCRTCGAVLRATAPSDETPLELVLENGIRVAVDGELTIGRAAGSGLWLEDPSVSRRHARVTAGPDGTWLEDVESSHGTFVDGQRLGGITALHEGTQIQVGDLILHVQLVGAAGDDDDDDDDGPGHTVVVPDGASLLIPAVGEAELQQAVDAETSDRPRLRSGHRLKRLGADDRGRWVIEDSRTGTVVQFEAIDGMLLPLLDGTNDVHDLVAESERLAGPVGPGRMARLLADLGERGLLSGIEGRAAAAPTGWRRLVRPRELSTRRLAGALEWCYGHGGWVLFTRPTLGLMAVVAVAGLVAEFALIAFRYGSPLIVASHLGLGGLVFLLARVALVACHETAHGLALASYGRRVSRAGLRFVLVFPFLFVETTEAWFEPRRHRLAVTLAGPVSDLVLGGALAIACLLFPAGTVRDVLFQAAFAAYVGALFNLNPFLDRDGYQLLVDYLGRPRLRIRARAELARRLTGEGPGDEDPALRRYALAGLGWSVVFALAAIAISLVYAPIAEQYVPMPVVYGVLGTIWVVLFIPVLATVVPPLCKRWRR